VRLLLVTRLLFWMHFVSAILVPFLRDWGGLDLALILFLNAWFMFWNFVLEVPTGAVADRFGRRVSLLLGFATGAIAVLVYVSTPRLGVFLFAEVMLAVSYTLISGADEALLYDSLVASGRTERAKRDIARLESAKLGGIVLGALGGAAMTAWLPLQGIMALQAIPMGLAAVAGLLLVEPPTSEASGARPSFARVLREGLGLVLASPALRRIALDLVSVGALCFLVIWLYQPLLEAAGIPIGGFGVVHVALSLGQIAVLQGADRLEDALGSRSRLLFGMALAAALGWIGLGLFDSPWLVVAGVVVVASFGLARGPLLQASLHRHIPSARRATAISGVSMLRTLAIVVANSAAGLGAQAALGPTALAIGAAVLLLAFAARTPEQDL
jgi:MFS family permease